MKVLGLTGSIGMGKTTAALLLRRLGVPVHDADAAVHRLLGKGGAAVPAVAADFPGVVRDGAVDRKALGARVFGDREAMRRLERILHPLVRQDSARFLQRARRGGARVAVLDIPLLFEVGRDRDCDATLVVSAPPFIQRARVLARPGMTERRFGEVLARQMPDLQKRRRADFVVPTGLGRRLTLRRLRCVLKDVRRSGSKGRRRALR
ncbi:MAG TPA: dephospho-CoA kinase [Methylomirabilota bacterium]|jgi:dephospho-CoA kinase|nr:dephospho-CoA kinase [Methylomirabilota bacterium]